MFIYLICNELLYSLSCRNLKKSVLNRYILANHKLIISLIILGIIQVLVLTTGLSKFFIVGNIGKINVIITLGICFIAFILGEFIKPLYVKLFKDYVGVKNEKEL